MVRTAAQIVLTKLCERFDANNEYKTIYDCIKRAHSLKFSRALKYAYAYEYRFTQIDLKNPLHSMYILREIPRITKMTSDEYYQDSLFDSFNEQMVITISDADAMEMPLDSVEIDLCFMENADEPMHSVNGNVQRKVFKEEYNIYLFVVSCVSELIKIIIKLKVVTYRETFIDRKILNSLPDEFAPKHAVSHIHTSCNNVYFVIKYSISFSSRPLQKSELIVLSSYISKAANLGGLSRSAEVFGVKALAIDNLKFLKQPEFTTLR